jgi:COMPASS component SWD3
LSSSETIEVFTSNQKPKETEKPEITPNLKKDILVMMIQYLQDEGYLTTAMTLQSEGIQKEKQNFQKKEIVKEVTKMILEGKWVESEQLLTKINLKKHKNILYCVYKQQYLELIEEGKHQKAFTFLMKRLKPLEEFASLPNEFKELSYALTCNSVQEISLFKDWDGSNGNSREKVVEMLNYFISFEEHELGDSFSSLNSVPPRRLLTMIEQSLVHQISSQNRNPTDKPKIESLLHDYESYIVPNSLMKTFKQHASNVKTIQFLGQHCEYLASAGSDNVINIFNIETGELLNSLEEHESRIWDLNCSKNSNYLASASGDSTIKIWSLNSSMNKVKCVQTIKKKEKYDFYCVKIHPGLISFSC